jgi:DNA-binding transcriptional LysR family regulator
LGTSLFHRLTRGVELTETGSLLLDEARWILDQVERIKAGVQSRARGETIHLGFARSALNGWREAATNRLRDEVRVESDDA